MIMLTPEEVYRGFKLRLTGPQNVEIFVDRWAEPCGVVLTDLEGARKWVDAHFHKYEWLFEQEIRAVFGGTPWYVQRFTDPALRASLVAVLKALPHQQERGDLRQAAFKAFCLSIDNPRPVVTETATFAGTPLSELSLDRSDQAAAAGCPEPHGMGAMYGATLFGEKR